MMEKRVQDLKDAIAQTAKDKQQAAARRSQAQSPGKESCRTIYLDACQQIASAFQPDGFRYAKSRQKMTRIAGEWKQHISFQSSRDNVAGARTALWVHANVGNTHLQQWRKANNRRIQYDAVGGGQLGNLSRPARWFDWDLTDEEQRARVVEEVITDLRRIALPYFEQFENVDTLVADLLNDAVSEVRIESAIELLLCYRNSAVAAEYVLKYLARRPDLRRDIAAFTQEFRATGVPYPRPTGYAIDVAAAIVEFRLDVQIA